MLHLIKKVFGKISYWRRTIVFFVWKPDGKIIHSNSVKNIYFHEIHTISDFPIGFLNSQLEQEYLLRFSKQHFCCVLTLIDYLENLSENQKWYEFHENKCSSQNLNE
jgi:hypothetical protein